MAKPLVVTGADMALVHVNDPGNREKGRWVRVRRDQRLPDDLFAGEEARLIAAGVVSEKGRAPKPSALVTPPAVPDEDNPPAAGAAKTPEPEPPAK